MATLLETLTVFVDKGGNRAEAARVLGLTPPGVSDRLRRLYLVEPDLVEEKAPEWVERNIKV
jgi:transcriptional regulator with GAF, ATPase, and Fis domain